MDQQLTHLEVPAAHVSTAQAICKQERLVQQRYLVSNYCVSGTVLSTEWERSNTTVTSCPSLGRPGLERGCGPRVLGERDQAGLASR